VALAPGSTELAAPARPALRVALLARTLRNAAFRVTHPGAPLRSRAILHKLASLLPQRLVGVPGAWTRYGGVPARWFRPAGSEGRPIVLYVHGGGYALCSTDTHMMLISDLARATGMACLAVEYRLAPVYPFPAPIDDCVAVYRGLLANGYAPHRIVLAGESAGGALVLATLQRLRDGGVPLPRAAILLSPWVDLECRGESIDAKADFDYLARDVLEYFARTYLQGADPRHPHASPIHADLRGLPPMLIQAGAEEALVSEIRVLAARARAHGVAVELQEWAGMFHAFHGFRFFLSEAGDAFDAVGRYTRRVFAGDEVPASRFEDERHFVAEMAALRAP